MEKSYSFWTTHRTSVFLQQSMKKIHEKKAAAESKSTKEIAELSPDLQTLARSSSKTSIAEAKDEDMGYFDTKFAGTAIRYNMKLRIRVVFADNKTLQHLGEGKMYAEVLEKCGTIRKSTRVSFTRIYLNKHMQ